MTQFPHLYNRKLAYASCFSGKGQRWMRSEAENHLVLPGDSGRVGPYKEKEGTISPNSCRSALVISGATVCCCAILGGRKGCGAELSCLSTSEAQQPCPYSVLSGLAGFCFCSFKTHYRGWWAQESTIQLLFMCSPSCLIESLAYFSVQGSLDCLECPHIWAGCTLNPALQISYWDFNIVALQGKPAFINLANRKEVRKTNPVLTQIWMCNVELEKTESPSRTWPLVYMRPWSSSLAPPHTIPIFMLSLVKGRSNNQAYLKRVWRWLLMFHRVLGTESGVQCKLDKCQS